jgi:hypothetical protein
MHGLIFLIQIKAALSRQAQAILLRFQAARFAWDRISVIRSRAGDDPSCAPLDISSAETCADARKYPDAE